MKTAVVRKNKILILALISLLFAPVLSAQNTNAFELRDGDRVVFLGDTFIEREQAYGHIEYLLTTHWPDRNITFRNLGWSADTPEGISRAGFDPAEKGWERLKEQLEAVKPSVVFLGYGMASSFEGEEGLAKFTSGINRVMDTAQQIAGGAPVRFVILSPIPHEKLPAPLPDPSQHNKQLELYTKALREIAGIRNTHFVPLFDLLRQDKFSRQPAPFLTDNGIHLTDYGYRRAAEVIGMSLRLEPHIWRVGLLRDGGIREGGFGTRVIEHAKTNNYARLVMLDQQLVNPPVGEAATNFPMATPENRLQVLGLIKGNYDLKIDGKIVKTVTDLNLAGFGLPLTVGPMYAQAEELRQSLLKKNELFFNRWRPENNTYLFLFRKHEQGQNAGEIPKFDPLVEAQEQKIAKLRKPVNHTIELVWSTNQADIALPENKSKLVTSTSPITLKPATPFRPQPIPEFQIEPGFEVSLFAENPQLAKPIQINFDRKGRLWVASSSVYPQIAPGQEADDKILVLEDTDNDGHADKTTVFADDLLIPTGVEPGDGGAYVGQSTELLHFKDLDGDGIADERRVVLSGFGTEDTHHTLHTLRWGFDGQLYMNQSIYIHSHLETPHGVVRLNSGGILNLRPQTMKLGIFMKGLINGWGHHYDVFGQSFATDGAGGAPPNGIFYVVPGGMYASYAGARRTLGSISPGSYPKFCGLEIIDSGHFPPEWQGDMITCDFRANRVVRFGVEEKDSAYVTKQMPDLLRTTNITFRPIDVKLGPDGALYIADWSNPIINHGEVDFRDARRDRVHGRIWRVTAKGRPLLKKPDFAAATRDLFSELLSSNSFTREQTRRILIERGPGILPDLDEWTASQKSEPSLLQALWMYQALNHVKSKLLERLLTAQDGHVRAAAVRVVGDWHDRLTDPIALLEPRVADDFPRVRLEAVRTLTRFPGARSAELVLNALKYKMDEFLDYAIWLSINELAEPWVTAVETGAWKPDGRETQLEFALKAIEPKLASRVLSRLLAGKKLPRDGTGGMIELIGKAGGVGELDLLYQQAQNGFDSAATARALVALGEAARLRNTRPSTATSEIKTFFRNPDENVRRAAIRLAGLWKVVPAVPELLKFAAEPGPLRQPGFDALRDMGSKEPVLRGLGELAAKSRDRETRKLAVGTLAAVDLNAAVPFVIDVLRQTPDEQEALAFWRSVLNVKGAGNLIGRSLGKVQLPESTARAGLRAAREGARSEPDLVLALARSANLSDESQNLTPAEIQQIASKVKDGNPTRGERIYRRKELGCVACHSIGGAGGKVGPDMTSIGASSPVDYLVESVFAPNRKVKEGYHSLQVQTKDEQELSGILVRETEQELVLRDAANKEVRLPKNSVVSRKIGGSLMPSGLGEILAPAERLDLFRFLSELGKPGQFDASKQNVARVWKVNAANATANDGDVIKSDLSGEGWIPVYTAVNGSLFKEDLDAELPLSQRREPFFAAARFQTARSGLVKLRLHGVNTPKAWLDGKPVSGTNEITSELPAGNHTFVLKLDPAAVPSVLKLETSEGAFLVD